MGPHRRQALRDIFIGTTVERTIRRTRHPLLMANAVPAGAYRHVLLTCDLSDSSIGCLQAALALSFLKDAETTVLHVFDSLAKSAMVRSALQPDDLQHQLDEETVLAKTKLREFLARAGVASHRQEVGHRTPTEAVTIHDYAEKQGMDLIVMGTQQRTGAAKYILGSVAEEVLRIAPTDVLVFPVGPFEDEETSVAARQPAR
jgi:nucleotide-binding universal stress UspA family protein